MKTILLFFPTLLFFLNSYAQDDLNTSFEKVQATYKPLSSSLSQGALTGPTFQVKAQLVIQLKPACEADSIFISMSEKRGSPELYNAAYKLATGDVTDGSGTVLFRQEGSRIQLVCPQAMPLRPYYYQLYTKNSSGLKSPVYNTIQ